MESSLGVEINYKRVDFNRIYHRLDTRFYNQVLRIKTKNSYKVNWVFKTVKESRTGNSGKATSECTLSTLQQAGNAIFLKQWFFFF